MSRKVLIIDDDPDLGKLVEAILKPAGMNVFQVYSGKGGLKKAYEIHPDLVILDVMMPDMDGFEVCARLREMVNIPILILTARAASADMLHAFNLGADDYLRKPFNKDELAARVQALFRRSNPRGGSDLSDITRYKDELLDINLDTQVVLLAGKIVPLSPMEYNLLACLVRNLGRIVTHRQILNEVWGSTYGDPSSTLNLYVFYLRKKLQDNKHGHQYIHTQWARGYWFAPRETE
jgi:two-component system KDP operon response regulator KdpE